MGWEKRGNGLYYYRKHRCGKKVYSEYVDIGPGVEAIALLEQQQRENASYRKQLEQKEQQRERKLRRDVDEICAFIRVLTGGHNVDQWLSQSSWSVEKIERLMMAALVEIPPELKDLRKVFRKLDKDEPSPGDIKAFKQALEDRPEMWRVVGDMAQNAATHMVESLVTPLSMKLSLHQAAKSLQHELGDKEATPLERLLIQLVVMAWTRLAIVEYAYTDVVSEKSSYQRLKYWDGRLNASQRRFLRASETLARIRKMNLPAVQVNIAEQQVNQLDTM